MSVFDFFGGAEGGDEFAGLFHVDGTEPDGIEPDAHDWHGADFGDHDVADVADYGTDHADTYEADGDGFDMFELDATGFDNDLTFDASYDLIGHDPDESGWWDVLASDHNHDGAYETVSYDTYIDPHVVH